MAANKIKLGKPAITVQESMEGGKLDKQQAQKIDAQTKQQRALQVRFFFFSLHL